MRLFLWFSNTENVGWVYGQKLGFWYSVHRRIVGCKTMDAWPKQSCGRGNFWAPWFSWLSPPLIYNANRVAKYSSSTTKLKFIGNSTLFLTPVQIKLYSTISNNRTIWKTPFLWLAKKDNLMLNNPFKGYGIHLNASHLNGMTPFEWVENSCMIIRY